LKLLLGGSYVYKVECVIYDVNCFDITRCERWMRHIYLHYEIDHDRNKMWIGDNLWVKTEEGQLHCLPGLCPIDVNERIVEQATFMGNHIIQKAEIENVSACLWKWAFFIAIHHGSDDDTLLPNQLLGEFHEVLTEFHVVFGDPAYANMHEGNQADFEITMDHNGTISFLSPYHISLQEDAELQR